MSADLAVQEAIRDRLVGTAAVTALVPATSIFDRHERPAREVMIVLGESQDVDAGSDLKRRQVRVYHTLHVWKAEPSLEGVKTICGVVRTAINGKRLDLGAGFHAIDGYVASMRYLRDPQGKFSHGVITVEVLVQELAA